MAQQEPAAQNDEQQPQQPNDAQPSTPKTESTAEFEGASDREPTGNPGVETKTESSSSSGQ